VAEPDLSVDPVLLTKAGDDLHDPAQQLRDALTKFLTTAREVGDRPWGTDSTGQTIERAYVASKVGNVLRSVQNLADGLEDVQARVRLMAAQYSNTEAVNSE
jgi:hypothetical protein